MIEQLRLRGGAASLLWGYRQVAVLGSWAILRALPDQKRKPGTKLQADKRKPQWQLQARCVRADAFQIRQKPLYFTAERQKGFWCWPILEPPTVKDGILRAYLGAPEQ